MAIFKKQRPLPGIYMLYGPQLYISDPKEGEGLDVTSPPHDTVYHQALIDLVIEWIIETKFVNGRLTFDSREEHKLPQYIYSLNFRTLTIPDNLAKCLNSLKDTDADFGMERIFSLHARLLAFADAAYLTRMVNKLYHGFTETAPGISDDEEFEHWTWPQLHATYPYLWVLWILQVALQSYNTRLSG